MDAVEFLEREHAHARNLVARMLATNAEQVDLRHQLFELLRQELEIHARLEEDLFYPAMARQGSWEKEQVQDSRKEHQAMRIVLSRLETIDLSGARWKECVIELNELLEHHLGEEEQELFPTARREIAAELPVMGDRLYRAKGELLREYRVQ